MLPGVRLSIWLGSIHRLVFVIRGGGWVGNIGIVLNVEAVDGLAPGLMNLPQAEIVR